MGKAFEGALQGLTKALDEMIEDWLRQMYPVPEPEPSAPEEIKDLLYNKYATSPPFERHNNLVIEAYRRGKASK